MRLTRQRLRLATGVLVCAVGLALCFSPGLLLERLLAGAAWLFIGGLLCIIPEFHLRFTRDWLTVVVGLLMVGGGLFFTLAAAWAFFGPRPHGLLPFYEFVGIGPLLLTTGVLVGFDKKNNID